jgi:hypothetical protein
MKEAHVEFTAQRSQQGLDPITAAQDEVKRETARHITAAQDEVKRETARHNNNRTR